MRHEKEVVTNKGRRGRGKDSNKQNSVKKDNQLSELLHTVRKLSSIESKVLLLMGLEAFKPLRTVSNSEHEKGVRVGLTWSWRDHIFVLK